MLKENNRVKHLTVDEARQIGELMEKANYHKDLNMRFRARLFLANIKQDMVDREEYEELQGFYQLEQWHKLIIPIQV